MATRKEGKALIQHGQGNAAQMVGKDASKYYQYHLFRLDLFQADIPKIQSSLSELTEQTICSRRKRVRICAGGSLYGS